MPSYAHYEDGKDPCLRKSILEEDLRNLTWMQIVEDLWKEDDTKNGVAKVTVIPSSPEKVLDGCKMPTGDLEKSLIGLFGDHSEKRLLHRYSYQYVAEPSKTLPRGVLEVYNTPTVSGPFTVKEYIKELHQRRQFGPLTGSDGDVLGTFWDTITNHPDTFNEVAPAYATDIYASVTRTSDWPLDLSTRMGRTEPLQNILMRQLKRDSEHQRFYPGLHSPFTYVGSAGSFFAFHEEDLNLFSMNIHLGGFPKIWYIIRPESRADFKAVALAALNVGYRPGDKHHDCVDGLRHKNHLFTPKWLDSWAIHYDVVVQRPNDIIVTSELGGHQGINTGVCVNEAINFGMKRWLPHGKRATVCNCGFYEDPVDPSILPLVAYWDTMEVGNAFIEGRPEGNTVITDKRQGYAPGAPSRKIQFKDIDSLIPTRENRYMMKHKKKFKSTDLKSSEEPTSREKLDEIDEANAKLLEEINEAESSWHAKQATLFGINYGSVWARVCRDHPVYVKAEQEAAKYKKDYLKRKGKTTVFC